MCTVCTHKTIIKTDALNKRSKLRLSLTRSFPLKRISLRVRVDTSLFREVLIYWNFPVISISLGTLKSRLTEKKHMLILRKMTSNLSRIANSVKCEEKSFVECFLYWLGVELKESKYCSSKIFFTPLLYSLNLIGNWPN